MATRQISLTLPSHESLRVMYLCVRRIYLDSFCNFSIGFWNWSKSVVYFYFHCITNKIGMTKETVLFCAESDW